MTSIANLAASSRLTTAAVGAAVSDCANSGN